MSQKLPIGDVMNEAVQFGLHRWATVLRFAWAPMLFSLLLFGLYFAVLFEPSFFSSMSEESSFEEFKSAMRLSLPVAVAGASLIYLFVILLFSGVAASLFRLVALGEDRPGIIHLRMDGPAVRVFVAYLIMMLIWLAIWGAAFLGALAITGESASGLFEGSKALIALAEEAEKEGANNVAAYEAVLGPMKVFGMMLLLAFIPLIYVTVKLAPFVAGSAAENRLLLFGSFAMTFGHAWSIFGVFVLYFLFFLIISFIYGLADEIFGMLADMLILQGSIFSLVAIAIYLAAIVVGVFFQLFSMALQTAVPAIIYRRLKTGE